MRRRSETLVLAIAALAAAGCLAPTRTEVEINRTWPAAGIEQLEVAGTNGRIEILADPSATEITMRARAKVSGNLEENEILQISIDGNVLTVKERQSSRRKFRLFGPERQISFEFHVPGDIRLHAKNVNGRIHVDGVDALMDLTTVNGSIEVSTPGGELIARTVNGSVRADFLEEFPGARLKTVNGSVRIRVPRNAQVSPEVRTVNGSFKSDIPVRINVAGDEGRLQVVTVNGSVTLSAFDRVNGLVPAPPALPEIPEIPEPPAAPAPPAPPSPI